VRRRLSASLCARETADATFGVVLLLAAAACLAALLHGSFAAFTWGKFTLFDYGVYTNMIWNSGRGELFRVLVDRTYLDTHLSFTLALLGPLFRVWDHPFLPALLQWLCLAAGAGILGAAAYRRGAGRGTAAALVFFFVAYPYSQSVVLSEFHGVCLYLVLVPLLYAFLVFRRALAWIPLLLILGLREDAFLVVVPMLLYVAAQEHWKTGYVLALAALLYGLLALFVLFPWISGMSLLARRSGEIGIALDGEALLRRGRALVWFLLPALVFLGRHWLPILVFPSVALVTAMAGGSPRQYALQLHYPAAVMACLGAGLAEAFAREGAAAAARPGRRSAAAAAVLVAVTLAAQPFAGFLPGGSRFNRVYGRTNPVGLQALRAARHIPKEGALVVPWQLAGFVANRADLLTWRTYEDDKHTLDVIFSSLKYFTGRKARRCLDLLESGTFGVRFFDGKYFVLQRGWDPSRNAEIAAARTLAARTIRLANTLLDAGSNRNAPGAVSVRHWEGTDAVPGPLVVYGRTRRLAPGRYEARLRYRTSGRPEGGGRRGGMLSLYVPGVDRPIAETDIEIAATPPGTFRVQALPFELDAEAEVEPRIRGGAVPLWLETVVLAAVNGAPENAWERTPR